jgi:exopolysaccharide production protein ExoF
MDRKARTPAATPRKNAAAFILVLSVGLVSSLTFITADRGREGGPDMLPRSAALAAIEPTRPMEPDPKPAPVKRRSALADLPKGNGGLKLTIGDRLKVTFYEELAPEAETRSRSRGRSLVERTELSGEYVIQLGGEVFLPMVGQVEIAQRSPAEAEAMLVDRAANELGEQLKVSIVVAEREPVYVMGAQSRGGAFKYSPGMVVAQAVTLAGGDAPGSGESWQQIDLAREQERMSKSMERLKRHLALLSVLNAEIAGAQPAASERLLALAGEKASELVEREKEARELERARHELQLASNERLISAMRADLTAMRARLDQVSSIVRDRIRRRDEITGRVGRGITTENLMNQARNEVVEIQANWHELRSAISRGEIRVLELERDRDQSRIAGQIDVDQKLRAARQVVAEEEVVMATVGQLLLKLAPSATGALASRETSYQLIRRTAAGPIQLAAEMLTPLEPGDVVQVVKRRVEASTVATATP